MDWITGMQKAIDYIEAHLDDEIDYDRVAKESLSSSYHFQRVFGILCGYTLGEYIRNRRLTLAGAELASDRARVIDVALKYGYDSPDSFAKAFRAFHGITPSQARGNGSMLRSFSRLSIHVSLEGGNMMDYRIESGQPMTLLGYKRRFAGVPHGKQREDQEHDMFISTRASQWMLMGLTNDRTTDICVVTGVGDDGYDFYIAARIGAYELEHLYDPEVTGIDFMERFAFEVLTIPAVTYAVFETPKQRYPTADYMDIRRRIAAEWLSGSGYRLADAPELSMYHWRPVGGKQDRSIEIWVPVVKE